jgi:hypothetical protein
LGLPPGNFLEPDGAPILKLREQWAFACCGREEKSPLSPTSATEQDRRSRICLKLREGDSGNFYQVTTDPYGIPDHTTQTPSGHNLSCDFILLGVTKRSLHRPPRSTGNSRLQKGAVKE